MSPGVAIPWPAAPPIAMARSILRTADLLSERIGTSDGGPRRALRAAGTRLPRGTSAGTRKTPTTSEKASAGSAKPATAQPILRRTRGAVKERLTQRQWPDDRQSVASAGMTLAPISSIERIVV